MSIDILKVLAGLVASATREYLSKLIVFFYFSIERAFLFGIKPALSNRVREFYATLDHKSFDFLPASLDVRSSDDLEDYTKLVLYDGSGMRSTVCAMCVLQEVS